jgi:hypothetical protein
MTEAGGPNPVLDAKLAIVEDYLRLTQSLVHAPASAEKYAEMAAAVADARSIIANVLCPGWWCENPECKLFVGTAKFDLQECRGCGSPRRKTVP